MIDYECSDDRLMSFYGTDTLLPSGVPDLEVPDIDEALKQSRLDQFNILASLMQNDVPAESMPSHIVEVQDPLQTDLNIVQKLQSRGIQSGPAMAEFLISSNKFNPRKYLKTIHHDLPIQVLESSLLFLGDSINNDSQDLKGILGDTYAKLITCKTSIDNVLLNIKSEQSQAARDYEKAKVFNPRAVHSKLDALYSNLERSVNSLNAMSALKIRPISQVKEREVKINRLMEFIRENAFLFDLPKKLLQFLAARDHDQFIDNYHRFLNEKQGLQMNQEDRLRTEAAKLSEDKKKIQQLKLDMALRNSAISRVINEVEAIAEQYRRKTFKELLSFNQSIVPPNHTGLLDSSNGTSAKFMALVKKLYELRRSDGTKSDNPISDFHFEQLRELDTELSYQIDKFNARFSMMQKRLADYKTTSTEFRANGLHVKYIAEKFNTIVEYHTAYSLAGNLDADQKHDIVMQVFDSTENLDLSIISETWLVLLNFIDYLRGVLAPHLSKFVSNYHQFYDDSIDANGSLQAEFTKLIEKVCEASRSCFSSDSTSKEQLHISPAHFSRFLPAAANSLSTAYYLTLCSSKLNAFFTALGELVGRMGRVRPSSTTNPSIKLLRSTATLTQVAILEAFCAVWNNDCSQLYDLEDWTIVKDELAQTPKTIDGAAQTKFVYVVQAYEDFIITKMHELLFSYNANKADTEFRIVASHPSKRVLMSTEYQFLRSLNSITDSVMKRYSIERSLASPDDDGIFKVLTINNVDMLSQVVFPGLIRRFDSLFKHDLASQNLSFFHDIEKARLSIYEDIVLKEKSWISATVAAHFESRESANVSVIQVDAVVYEVLTHLVKVLHMVRPISGPKMLVSLINEVQLEMVHDVLRSIHKHTDLTLLELLNWRLGLNFFSAVFDASRSLLFNKETISLLQVLLKAILERIGPIEGVTDPKRALASALKKNLNDSRHQFSCF